MILITQGVTGFDFFKTNRCTNISCFDEIDRVLLISKHLHDTADTFFFTASHIQYIRTSIQVTRINPEKCKTTYERIGHDLESQCCKRFFCIRLAGFCFTSIRVNS
ncbi:hypothetical protein D3C83_46680 [compost metagenome]